MASPLAIPSLHPSMLNEAAAQVAASKYVSDDLDPSFEAVKGLLLRRQPPQWRFVIRSANGPLGYLFVEAETGAIAPLTEDEKRIVRERALIAAAESRHELPVVAQGYVPVEYARRRANGYLTEQLSLSYSAVDGRFVAQGRLQWQFTIRFRLPRRGIAGDVGTLSVEARTGDPIPLTSEQLNQSRDRAHALIRS